MEERYPEKQVCMWSDTGKWEEESTVQSVCPNLKTFPPQGSSEGTCMTLGGKTGSEITLINAIVTTAVQNCGHESTHLSVLRIFHSSKAKLLSSTLKSCLL